MELVQKHKVKDYLPQKNGWFDTNKGNIYFFVEEQEWSCRDDRISNEYPDWWLGKFPYETQQINNEALLYTGAFAKYLIMVGIRSLEYRHDDKKLFDNIEYFKLCKMHNLSAYKALLFLQDYIDLDYKF